MRAAVSSTLDELFDAALDPGLYLVATPIGHLGDISLRALSVLARADVVYCEDTRVSQTLFQRYGMKRKLRTYHDHSDASERDRIVDALAQGGRIALISDAGTPGVADPGFKLVRAAVEAGHRIIPIPGPAALIAAVVASGLPSDQFFFAGFLPQKAGQRRKALTACQTAPTTQIFYETPHRLAASLSDMADILGASRPAVVGRELTKKYEELVRGPLHALADWAASAPVRGEMVVVVGPNVADPNAVSDETIAAALSGVEEGISPTQAAKRVADALGVARARVYAIGLRMKHGDGGQ